MRREKEAKREMVEEWVMERAKGWVVCVHKRVNEGAREMDKGERVAW